VNRPQFKKRKLGTDSPGARPSSADDRLSGDRPGDNRGSPRSDSSTRSPKFPVIPAQTSFPQSQLNPLGLLAAASSDLLARDPSCRRVEGLDEESSFLEEWFTQTAIDPSVHVGDDPISKSILTEQECDDIFEHFWECLNVFALLLDPVLHSQKRVRRRSPILFTCICHAVLSSASFAMKSSISPTKVDRVAQLVEEYTAKIFSSGWKGVEVCQSLLLLVFWTKPSKAFEQDPCWLMFGVVRILIVSKGYSF
jgi:hypothetical protein